MARCQIRCVDDWMQSGYCVLFALVRLMICNRLSELRKKQSISQQALAEAIGATRQTINAIENERVVPTLLMSFKIARYFDVAIEEVFSLNS